ncbi:MAG: DUF1080 domain-containing protein [Bacteroidota bacterium]
MKIVNLLNILFSLVLIMGITSCASTGKTKSSADDGWITIFDGKTTTGWRGYNKTAFPEKGWEVVDGTLHCMSPGGGGDIIYDRKLSNFELELEWKISPVGNSGIFFLGQEVPGEPIYRSAPEMQILDNEKHPDGKQGINGNRLASSLYDLIPAIPQNTKPVGEWNKVGILCNQGTVVFKSNGANVVEFHLWTDDWKKLCANSKFKDWEEFVNPAREGYIGLQDHGNDVWFRNIRLKIM